MSTTKTSNQKPSGSTLPQTTSKEYLRVKRRGRYQLISRRDLQRLTTTRIRSIRSIRGSTNNTTTKQHNNKPTTQHNTTPYSKTSNYSPLRNPIKLRGGHTTFCLWNSHCSCVGRWLGVVVLRYSSSFVPRVRGTLSRLKTLLVSDSNKVTTTNADPPTSHPNSRCRIRGIVVKGATHLCRVLGFVVDGYVFKWLSMSHPNSTQQKGGKPVVVRVLCWGGFGEWFNCGC